MKIKEGFVLREVLGDYLVVAVGDRVKEFNGMLTLNATSKLIFEGIKKGLEIDQIANLLVGEYEISKDKAVRDVNSVVETFKKLNIVE